MSYFEGASNEPTVPTHAPAGYGKRVQAAIVDFLIVVAVGIVPIVVFIIGLAAAIDASDKGEPAAGGTMMLLGGLAGLAWFAWQVWLFGYRQGASGTTPGKRMAGIRLTGIGTGVEPGGGVGVGRFIVPTLVNSVIGVYWIIDYLWPLWDDGNQRVTDKMFKTQVVLGGGPTAPVGRDPIIT
ncbi:MAG: RDD family protein [Acidimicrobiales bacterium]|jgi:uncharacterized RDD family membrane protein YckC|nr:RDD family protein [Acidimicrobiales bacterium]